MGKKRVIIIGGGFGGLNAAKSLKKFDGEILLFDKMNHNLFQPLLYQVATCALSDSNIAVPIREILSKQKNTQVLMANVIRISLETNEIEIESGELFFFDYLIIAAGSTHSYFGNEAWEKYAPGLKTIDDALTIREQILYTFEKAELMDMPHAQEALRFVIVGGGPTGVEMAGAIAEIAKKSLFQNFRHIKPEQSEIYLVEGQGQLLPSYPRSLAEKAKKDLEKMGVKVLLNQKVKDIDATGVQIEDQHIFTTNVVWAAGNQATPLLKFLNTPLDAQGRVFVNKDLSIPSNPNIFVIGDAAHFEVNGSPLPGVAPAAIQEGKYVGKLILKNISPNERKPFKYFDKGNLATIGRAKAVGVFRKLKFSGLLAWLIWSLVHVAYLITYSNRILVMVQWMFWYLTGNRQVRIITHPSHKR